MITAELKEVIDNISKWQRDRGESSYKRCRRETYDFLKSKVQGLQTDISFQYLYLFDKEIKPSLYHITNSILSTHSMTERMTILISSLTKIRRMQKHKVNSINLYNDKTGE